MLLLESTDNKVICNDVLEKFIVNFEAEISVDENECVNKNDSTIIKFELLGFPKDELVVVTDCEKCVCEGDSKEDAAQCSYQGTLHCGGCQCHEGVSNTNIQYSN